MIEISTLTGSATKPYQQDLARLRIEVFREFPYLYDGDDQMEYEMAYLSTFFEAEDAIMVLAKEGETVVGASTGLPLSAETDNIQRPFREAGSDLSAIFYLSESVLLKPHRGQGIGLRFFEQREAWAKSRGYGLAVFCRVVRMADDPHRPADYVPLDRFWQHRGYHPLPDHTCQISWKELGETSESPKTLEFWQKPLT